MSRPRPLLIYLRLLVICISALAASPSAARAYDVGINCGGADVVDGTGTLYRADTPYPGTSGFGYVDGDSSSVVSIHPLLIDGTADPDLFVNGRSSTGPIEYRFDVPAGEYLITLHVADAVGHNDELNRFRVTLEGIEVEGVLRPHFPNRRHYASRFSWRIAVHDSAINLVLDPISTFEGVEVAQVQAIHVQTSPPPLVPPVPQGVDLTPTYDGVVVTWDMNIDERVTAYDLERRTGGGSWTNVAGTPLHARRFVDDLGGEPGPADYRLRGINDTGLAGPWTTIETASPIPRASSTLDFYELEIDSTDIVTLDIGVQTYPGNDDYVDAHFRYIVNYPDVRTRYRGWSNLFTPKKSRKVNFRSEQPFEGMDKVNLNSAYYDPFLQKERSAFALWTGMDAPAPDVRPVNLLLNGAHQGVHQRVEQVDEFWLDRMGLSPEGNLYKCKGNLSVLGNPDLYLIAYEHKWGPAVGNADIISFIENLNGLPDSELIPYLVENLDLGSFATWYAMNILISNWDFTTHNYYMYHHPASDGGRWILIPWDMDLAWGFGGSLTEPWVEMSLTYGMEGDPETPPNLDNRLISRFLPIDVFRYFYLETMVDIYAGVFHWEILEPMLMSFRSDIDVEGRRDPWKYGKERNESFDLALGYFEEYHTGRIAFIIEHWDEVLPPFDEDVSLNEILALNASVIQDETGEFDPWIELRNNHPIPRNLAGWSLTNDPTDTLRWVFPEIEIPPFGHLLVWADAEPEDGPLHTSFTIDPLGGTLSLYRPATASHTLADSITIGVQAPDVSVGRYPDGHGTWQPMTIPTPGAPNWPYDTLPPDIIATIRDPDAPEEDDIVSITSVIVEDVGLAEARLVFSTTAWEDADSLDMAVVATAGDTSWVRAVIGPHPLETQVRYFVRARDNEGFSTTDPVGAPANFHGYTVAEATPPLFVNEFLASNDSVNQDEAGEYDDWVELYNAGPEPVALGGLSLTDDFSSPRKWIFPDTTIAAGGWLLVWCDDDPHQGPLHATFKLSASGEEIGIFTAGLAVVDSVTFDPQSTDISQGRFPDGASEWQLFTEPTPGESNGGVVSVPSAGDHRPLRFALAPPRPHPFNSGVTLGLALPSPQSAIVWHIYDVAGRNLQQMTQARVPAGMTSVRWDGRDSGGRALPPGVYFYRVSWETGAAVGRVVRIR